MAPLVGRLAVAVGLGVLVVLLASQLDSGTAYRIAHPTSGFGAGGETAWPALVASLSWLGALGTVIAAGLTTRRTASPATGVAAASGAALGAGGTAAWLLSRETDLPSGPPSLALASAIPLAAAAVAAAAVAGGYNAATSWAAQGVAAAAAGWFLRRRPLQHGGR